MAPERGMLRVTEVGGMAETRSLARAVLDEVCEAVLPPLHRLRALRGGAA